MAQSVEMNSPAAVAARMIGSDAPAPRGETNPTSTMPRATDPTMKLGSPSDKGSPARGPLTSGVASASTESCCTSGALCGTSGGLCWTGAEACCVELAAQNRNLPGPLLLLRVGSGSPTLIVGYD